MNAFALAVLISRLPAPAITMVGTLVSHWSPKQWAPRHEAGERAPIHRICEKTVAVWVGGRGDILNVNAYFANILGYQRDELIGRPLATIVAGPYRRHEPIAPFTQTIPHRHKAGHIMPLKVTCYPVMLEPGKAAWIGIAEEA